MVIANAAAFDQQVIRERKLYKFFPNKKKLTKIYDII